MDKSDFSCPFVHARTTTGTGRQDDQGDPVTMLLRLKDVRRSAHQYQRFSSEATPGRIVVPSEVDIRSIRQIPFELDPPRHTAYRALLEEWFRRPLAAAYAAALSELVNELLDTVSAGNPVEVVGEFALPLQSRALTLLLNVPRAEAAVWIGWGTHVFRSEETALDGGKAGELDAYIDAQIERAAAAPGADLYSLLLAADIGGRPLTREEIRGVMNLTFAGGRDTVINAVTNTVAYLAEHPEALARLRSEPEITGRAVEELLRYFAPLTQTARIVAEDTTVCDRTVSAGSRISLCWASANRDETVFDRPEEVLLDRGMNPHLSFGFGTHNCLGATHARQLLTTLLTVLAGRVASIDLHDATVSTEHLDQFQRKVGFHRLRATFNPL